MGFLAVFTDLVRRVLIYTSPHRDLGMAMFLRIAYIPQASVSHRQVEDIIGEFIPSKLHKDVPGERDWVSAMKWVTVCLLSRAVRFRRD